MYPQKGQVMIRSSGIPVFKASAKLIYDNLKLEPQFGQIK
ncbi:hypothetical protein NY10_1610 [Carnobacterium antarcticum]|nr:hypothetical protein NY10_1610 [Carnobacterium sp. CP1]